jgi:hypothetical protein
MMLLASKYYEKPKKKNQRNETQIGTRVNGCINLNLEFPTNEEKFVIKVASTTQRQFHM